MTTRRRFTLTQYLIEQRRRFPGASGDFNALLLDVALACKAIARTVAFGELGSVLGNPTQDVATGVNVQGEEQKKLDVISNEYFTQMTEWGGHLAGMASEEMDHPYQIPATLQRGKYMLVFDPLDGSSNIDVNVTVGSIFSVLRAPQDVIDSGRDVVEADFLQPGTQQMAAGYALYGPTTMLVLTVGNGVADDKLVYTYMPDLTRYYLGEDPIIENVHTWRLEEEGSLEEVLDRLDELVVKPVDGSGGKGLVVGPAASKKELDDLRKRLIKDPRGWIAQPVVQFSTIPTLVEGGLRPRHADLRPFAVNSGNDIWVLPGGLTRVALPEGELVVNSSQGGGSKDTWIVGSDRSTSRTSSRGSSSRARRKPRSLAFSPAVT